MPRSHAALALLGDGGLAVAIVALGLWFDAPGGTSAVGLLALLAAAAAAGVARVSAVSALGLLWAAAVVAQLWSDVSLVSVVVAIVAVGYRCGRWGSRVAVWAAGLSVPAGAATAVAIAWNYPDAVRSSGALTSLIRSSGVGVVGGLGILLAVLGAPFAVGLLGRANERYRVTRREREFAEAQAASEHEVAVSRARQTQLTRDVHDVVGHSLAVIIAQSDSARLAALDDDVRTQLEQIAAVGRSSLAEVRDVLSRTDDAPVVDRAPPELDELIAGVRAAGHPVEDTSSGNARPLEPETGVVAYRVLQEFLTNALKHGAGPLAVEREWTPSELVLRVTNPVPATTPPPTDGRGLAGVRSRLAAAHGTLRITVADHGTDRARLVATAHLPVA